MGDLIAIVIIVLILGCVVAYIVKAKKSGVHCIGCPTGSSCSGHCQPSESIPVEPVEAAKCGCATGGGCNCTEGSSCSCGDS